MFLGQAWRVRVPLTNPFGRESKKRSETLRAQVNQSSILPVSIPSMLMNG